MPTEFNDYYSFFSFLTMNCQKEEHTHISWCCTLDKKSLCSHIQGQWDKFVDTLSLSDSTYTIQFEYFKRIFVPTKNGPKKRLTQVIENVGIAFLVKFVSDLLPEIIHHRNELKYFRSVVKIFHTMYNSIYIDMDYSERI